MLKETGKETTNDVEIRTFSLTMLYNAHAGYTLCISPLNSLVVRNKVQSLYYLTFKFYVTRSL